MRWYFCLFSVFFILAIPAVRANAGSSGCSVDVPVNVVTMTGGVIRNLKPADLVAASAKSQPLKIDSVTYDNGPRRILFVLDTVHDLPSDARKAEAKIVERILASARPSDSFALITARGTARAVKFDQGRDALKQAVGELANDPKEKSGDLGVLDAVMEGISWFGEPKSGDSLFLMAMDLEGNSKTNVKKIAHELDARHMRLFGLVLGPINLGSTVSTQSDNYKGQYSYATAGTMPDTRDQDFYPLAMNSGGYLVGDNTMTEHKEYKLTDERLQRLQSMGLQFYQVMTDFQHLRVESPSGSQSFKLTLSESAQERFPKTAVLYPRQVECK